MNSCSPSSPIKGQFSERFTRKQLAIKRLGFPNLKHDTKITRTWNVENALEAAEGGLSG
jgi:hypothetical protein